MQQSQVIRISQEPTHRCLRTTAATAPNVVTKLPESNLMPGNTSVNPAGNELSTELKRMLISGLIQFTDDDGED